MTVLFVLLYTYWIVGLVLTIIGLGLCQFLVGPKAVYALYVGDHPRCKLTEKQFTIRFVSLVLLFVPFVYGFYVCKYGYKILRKKQ